MTRGARRVGTTVLAVTLALVASACTAGVDGGAGGQGAAGGVVGSSSAQKEVRLAIGGESEDGYDPTLGWGRYGSPLFQSTLLKRDADLKIVNDLATKHTVSPDGLVWTVDIRTDAKFSDGTPVTAADAAYTFSTASKSGGLSDVTGLSQAVAVDNDTVELRLKRPQSTFVNRLISLGIVPKHAHGKEYARKPIGSGPFKLVRWDEGQQLIVQRNDSYYGTKPAFERIVFTFTGEDASLAAAKAGQVSMAAVPSSLAKTSVPKMRLVPVKSVDNRGLMFPYQPDTGKKTAAGLPIGNNVTSDKAIRQAINQVVDRQALVDGVLEGYGSPATGPVDGMPWFEPSSAIQGNDAGKAKELLESAGWKDSNGVRERAGVKAAFTLLYPAGDTTRQGLALAVADMVKPVGIQITTKGVSWDVIDKRLHADAVLFGWGSQDPTELYNLYSSGSAGVGYWNPGYYTNPIVQKNLDAAMSATDQDEATKYWKAAQRDADGNGFGPSGDAAWAWLVNLQHTYYVSDCLDIGKPQIEPHGHGWPITAGITGWRWTC